MMFITTAFNKGQLLVIWNLILYKNLYMYVYHFETTSDIAIENAMFIVKSINHNLFTNHNTFQSIPMYTHGAVFLPIDKKQFIVLATSSSWLDV